MTVEIFFKKLHPAAKLPTKGKPGDAAFDICCLDDTTIHPGQVQVVSTGILLADMPTHYHGAELFLQIEGRSGLAAKGIMPFGGIVDATYRGEVKVILFNCNIGPVSFKAGDRIAQLLVRMIAPATIKESQEVTETSRGASGFGSTGA